MARPLLAALSLMTVAFVSGCSSTQDVLEPSAINPPSPVTTTPPENPQPSQAQVSPAATPAPSPQANAAVAANARIQFAPVVGASVTAATALSERLGTRARELGMTLTGVDAKPTTHLMKGYFTPLTEGKETTVIYVWDVYDPAGNRVHRISGQQKAPAGGKEGWDSVSPGTMRAIAGVTMDQLFAWLAGKPG